MKIPRSPTINAMPAVALGALLLGGLAWGVALGQSSSASYQIPRQTIDAGGTRMSSGSFTLTGTIGQPDAGPRMSSANFRMQGGFHRRTPGELEDRIFSDRFQMP